MKRNNRIEFGVSSVKSSGTSAIIEGRCYHGPFHTGDVFTAISEMTVQKTENTVGPTTLKRLATANLKIDSILAYGHQIDELSQTVTARLEVSGTGIDNVKEGLVLS